MSNVVEFTRTASKAPICFTLYEAADALRLSRSTIDRMVKRGDLKTVRVGAFQRVPASEIERLLTPQPAA